MTDKEQKIIWQFLPRDASAESGYEIVLSVRLSVCLWRSGIMIT